MTQDGLGGGTGVAGIIGEINVDTIITGSTRLYFRDAGIFIQSDADGGLLITADGTSGNVIKARVGDVSGNSRFAVVDSQNFPMVELNSDGDVRHKGQLRKTTTDQQT